jgi:hypothetical protein
MTPVQLARARHAETLRRLESEDAHKQAMLDACLAAVLSERQMPSGKPDMRDHYVLMAARATLRSPLYQSDEDLRRACRVLHRLGDPQDGEMARHMLLMLDQADLQKQAPPSNFKTSLFLAVALCAGTLVVLAVGEWWLS